MHGKRFLSGLLAALLALTLCACSARQDADAPGTSAAPVPTEKISGEYDDAAAQLETFYREPTAASFAALFGAGVLQDEVLAYLQTMIDSGAMDEAAVLEQYGVGLADLQGMRVTQAVPLTEEELQVYRDQLPVNAQAYRARVEMLSAYTDEEWETAGAAQNMTAEQMKTMFAAMQPELNAIADKLDAAEITKGYTLTCIATDGEGAETTSQIQVLLVNDVWVSQLFFTVV